MAGSLALFVTVFVALAAEQGNPAASMKLIVADKFSIEVPEFASVVRTGPSSISNTENYTITQAFQPPHIFVGISPYQTSVADVAGSCTVSLPFDQGDPNAPVFCEGQKLAEKLPTKVGYAKWIHAVEPNSPTMHSGPLLRSEAFIHTYIAIVPLKSDGIIIEFYAAATGTREEPNPQTGAKLWPMIRDEILPSLARMNCK